MSLLGVLFYLVVGQVGLTIALYMLSFFVPKAAFAARCVAAYLSLAVAATYGMIASIVLRLAGNHRIAQWTTARAFAFTMSTATGITFEVEDPNNYLGTTRPAVFIGNHQTELDVLMLGYMFPKYCSVTAKKSLKYYPLLGWFMSLSGTVFIDRKNSKDARSAMAGAAQEIKKHRQSVYMFPEGTRSYAKEPMLLPFKKGAFHLAVEAGVPIVPVAVANYSHVLYIRNLIFRSGRIPCKVLEPIPTTGLTAADVTDLTQKTRDMMLKEIIMLTEKARGHPIPVPAANGKDGVVKVSGADTTLS